MKCLSRFKTPCSWIPQRYFLAIFILLGLNFYFWMTVSVILALSEMTFPNPPALPTLQGSSASDNACPSSETHAANKSETKAEFHWDQPTQHLIIQGFYYGYMVANIPGGVMADTFGGKTVFGAGYLLSAVMVIVLPFLARTSPYCFFAGRVVQGAGQGLVLPSVSSLVARWAPPNERATITGITRSGIMFGNASGFIVSGLILAATPGWEHVYYITGSLGVLWVVAWYLLCYSSPAHHPFVTDKERNMIESRIAHTSQKKPKHIPWAKIFTSMPLLSAVLANYGHLWANFTMTNEMPTYLSKVLHFDIRHSGLFSATPHLSMSVSTILTGYVCDRLVKKGIMSVTVNRKLFIFLSNTLPVPFLMAASLSGCDRVWVVVLFAIMMFFKGLAYATLKVQPIDLSPNYAGILMGILNGSGAISGFVSPMVVPLFITGDGSLGEWRRFFALSGGMMIVPTLPFLCFGSGSVQPWNSEKEEDGQESERKPEQENEQKPQ